MDITQLLAFSVKNKASDLHLSAGLPPMIRVHGDVRRINVEALDHKMVHDMVYDIMNDAQRKHYEDTLECAWRVSASTPSTRTAAPAPSSARSRARS
jgi:twitching motility protein PilT